ncbi:MAG: alpha/beta fold hydrolase [Deltaproteobacteria bacterium]|nr:alpha/beta fold hydrolase [Deltaproteobacteria bacterium]
MTTIVVVAVLLVLAVLAAVVVRRTHVTADDAAPLDQNREGAEPSETPFIGVEAVLSDRPPPAPDRTPLPVVMVHGLYGFDRFAGVTYFRGIARHLGTLGCHAHAVRLPFAASVPARAKELVAAIDALPHERIDLIAHSLGGLDARYALARLGLDRRVRSLVTIGTPHRGTPIADLVVGGMFDRARRIVGALGVPVEALEWLSTAALAKFNAEIENVAGVRYASVIGGIRAASTPIPLPLVPAHSYLRRVAGANDGLVPMASQYWGETLAEIEADHFAQVGWRVSVRRSFDALGLYAFIVARLGDLMVSQEPMPAVASSATTGSDP